VHQSPPEILIDFASSPNDIGNSGQDLTLFSYMVGPRYTWRKLARFVPFGQILLGGAHASGSFASGNNDYPGSSNSFASATGGGLNFKVNERIAVRAFQADYFLTHFANGINEHQNNLRIGTGIIIDLGRR
jgi:outer membrane immunogenic protein